MNIPYHLALRLGRLKRSCYARMLPRIARRPVASPRPVNARLLYLLGRKEVPEFVASARSFLRWAGRPAELIVASDGTLDETTLRLLASLPQSPTFWRPADYEPGDAPRRVREYFREHAFGKKLGLLLKAQTLAPIVYADSDILFFPGATDVPARIEGGSAPVWFLPDCAFSLDRRMLDRAASAGPPVNAGFLIFNRPVDFRGGLERFARLDVPGEFFTEQTIVHLGVTQAGGVPLPAQRYVLQNDDQWLWRDKYARADTALRHYISSFRHKMWMRVRPGV